MMNFIIEFYSEKPRLIDKKDLEKIFDVINQLIDEEDGTSLSVENKSNCNNKNISNAISSTINSTSTKNSTLNYINANISIANYKKKKKFKVEQLEDFISNEIEINQSSNKDFIFLFLKIVIFNYNNF